MAGMMFDVFMGVLESILNGSKKTVDWKTEKHKVYIRGSRWGTGGPDHPPPPLKYHKNKGFLSNTGPDYLKYHKATKPAFNVEPSSVRQENAI